MTENLPYRKFTTRKIPDNTIEYINESKKIGRTLGMETQKEIFLII